MTSFGCENGMKVIVRSGGLRRKDITRNSKLRNKMTTLLTNEIVHTCCLAISCSIWGGDGGEGGGGVEERERNPGPGNNLTKKRSEWRFFFSCHFQCQILVLKSLRT